MELKDVGGSLAGLQKIIEGWKPATGINPIERDLVLQRLREIYELVLLADISQGEVQECSSGVTVGEEEPRTNESSCDCPHEQSAGEVEQQEPEAEVESEIAGTLFRHEDILEFRPESARDRKALLSLYDEDDEEAKPSVQPELIEIDMVGMMAVEDESEAAAEVEVHSVVVQETIVEEEIVVETEAETEAGSAAQKPAESHTEPVAEPDTEPEDNPDENNVAEAVQQESVREFHGTVSVTDMHKPVLGEALNNGTHVIGETIEKHPRDIASVIVAGEKTSLRSMIGFNDRFMIMNELFEGDAESYEQALDVFDRFTDLGDALIYIYDNYKWAEQGDGAKLFVDLLSRKLS